MFVAGCVTLPCQGTRKLMRTTCLEYTTSRLLFLHVVCAQHEHVHTFLKALRTCLKYKILVSNGKTFSVFTTRARLRQRHHFVINPHQPGSLSLSVFTGWLGYPIVCFTILIFFHQ